MRKRRYFTLSILTLHGRVPKRENPLFFLKMLNGGILQRPVTLLRFWGFGGNVTNLGENRQSEQGGRRWEVKSVLIGWYPGAITIHPA